MRASKYVCRYHSCMVDSLNSRRIVATTEMTDWEGGTRGVSFVSGGFLPTEMRGKISMDMVHVTDWCKRVTLSRSVALSRLADPDCITIADSTFCYLAGVDPEDPNTVGTYSDGKSRTII